MNKVHPNGVSAEGIDKADAEMIGLFSECRVLYYIPKIVPRQEEE